MLVEGREVRSVGREHERRSPILYSDATVEVSSSGEEPAQGDPRWDRWDSDQASGNSGRGGNANIVLD
jgi:hypothetical protein